MRAKGDRLRVLFVGHTAQPSGGELALLNLLRASIDWLEPSVILFENGPIGTKLTEDGVSLQITESLKHLSVARRGRAVSLRTALALARLSIVVGAAIRRDSARIVYCNSVRSFVIVGLVARVLGRKVVWHCRDRVELDYFSPGNVRLLRLLGRIVPHLVIANSRATAATITHRNVTVIPSPIDAQFFDRPLRHRFTSAPTSAVLVGRITPWKGQDVAIKALEFLPESTTLTIVGSALFGEEDFERELERLVEDLGLDARVRFSGFTDDVVSVLDGSDVLLHTSVLPEPFGQVVVQGLAAGIPVVSVGTGGPAEYLADAQNALLVPPNDPAQLAAAIQRLASDPLLAKSLVVAGLETAEQFRSSVTSTKTRAALVGIERL